MIQFSSGANLQLFYFEVPAVAGFTEIMRFGSRRGRGRGIGGGGIITTVRSERHSQLHIIHNVARHTNKTLRGKLQKQKYDLRHFLRRVHTVHTLDRPVELIRGGWEGREENGIEIGVGAPPQMLLVRDSRKAQSTLDSGAKAKRASGLRIGSRQNLKMNLGFARFNAAILKVPHLSSLSLSPL